jgi:DNA invertase Pin-like site-specific DNA recombinase
MLPSPAVKKAYSYLRFSTPEQALGDSRRRQTKLAEEYALAHKLTLDTELNLHDLGVSAFRGDNIATGALGAFLDAVKQGIVEKGSFLLVESLDRVSRAAARKAVRVLEDIVEAGITVVTLNDGKAYTEESLDGFDFLMAILILIRAHEESATKARRLKAAWVGKRLKVKEQALTAVTPGWISLDSSRKPQLIPERAKVVRRIAEAVLKGMGKESIARQLNTEGVPTFGRARRWHRSYIDKILMSPALVGTFVPHVDSYDTSGKLTRVPQEPVPGYFPAVIETDTFERVQAINRTSPLRGRHAHTEVRNILSGLAKCPKCNSTMTRVSKGPKERPLLVCVTAKMGAGCSYHAVHYEAVENALLTEYRQVLDDMPHADTHLAGALRQAQVTLDATEGRAEELAQLLEKHPSETLARKLAGYEQAVREARDERDKLAARAVQSERKAVALKAKNLGVALRARPVDRRRINAALRELLTGVTVDFTTGYLEFAWRAGGESSLLYGWPSRRRERAERDAQQGNPKDTRRRA